MNTAEMFKYLFEKYGVNDFYIGYVKHTWLGVSNGNADIEIGGEWKNYFYHTVLLKLADGSFIDIRHPENEIERELVLDHEGYTLEYAEPITEYCDPDYKDKGEMFGFRALAIGKENYDRFDQNRLLTLANKSQETVEEAV